MLMEFARMLTWQMIMIDVLRQLTSSPEVISPQFCKSNHLIQS
jgi:hypothetical protein